MKRVSNIPNLSYNYLVGDCVLCITGLNEELQEEDLLDVFSEFGAIKNLHFNLDKRTGYAKGYAFIEYENRHDASDAIKGMDGKEIAEKKVRIDWAFKTEGKSKSKHRSKRRD